MLSPREHPGCSAWAMKPLHMRCSCHWITSPPHPLPFQSCGRLSVLLSSREIYLFNGDHLCKSPFPHGCVRGVLELSGFRLDVCAFTCVCVHERCVFCECELCVCEIDVGYGRVCVVCVCVWCVLGPGLGVGTDMV